MPGLEMSGKIPKSIGSAIEIELKESNFIV